MREEEKKPRGGDFRSEENVQLGKSYADFLLLKRPKLWLSASSIPPYSLRGARQEFVYEEDDDMPSSGG